MTLMKVCIMQHFITLKDIPIYQLLIPAQVSVVFYSISPLISYQSLHAQVSVMFCTNSH